MSAASPVGRFVTVSGIAVPQTRYSSGVLALMHSAQYLWITQYFAKRDQGAGWQPRRYWIAVIAGGAALFLPIPWLASYTAGVDFTASVLIVTAIVYLFTPLTAAGLNAATSFSM